jgi:predicted secreted acid phosphatase
MKKTIFILLLFSFCSLFAQESLVRDFIKEKENYSFTIFFGDNSKDFGEMIFEKESNYYRTTITNKTREFSSTFDFIFISEFDMIIVGNTAYYYELINNKLNLIPTEETSFNLIEIKKL